MVGAVKTKTNIFYVRILSEKWETKCQTRKQKQNWAYNFCLLLFSRTHCCRMLNSFLFFLSFIFQASLVIICSPACCIIIWFVYVALVCFFFRCAKRKEKDKHKPTNNQQNTTIYLFSFCFKATWKIKFKQKRNNQSDRQHHVCMHAQSCNYDFFLFSNLCFLLCCSCIQHIKFHLEKIVKVAIKNVSMLTSKHHQVKAKSRLTIRMKTKTHNQEVKKMQRTLQQWIMICKRLTWYMRCSHGIAWAQSLRFFSFCFCFLWFFCLWVFFYSYPANKRASMTLVQAKW